MEKGDQLLDSTPSHQWFITTGVDYLMAFQTRITGRGTRAPPQTREETIGHIADFIMHDKTWAICHLVGVTQNDPIFWRIPNAPFPRRRRDCYHGRFQFGKWG